MHPTEENEREYYCAPPGQFRREVPHEAKSSQPPDQYEDPSGKTEREGGQSQVNGESKRSRGERKNSVRREAEQLAQRVLRSASGPALSLVFQTDLSKTRPRAQAPNESM